MRFYVAIRTISLFPDGEAVYNVGGGIVFDSTAEAEYAGMSAEGAFRDGNAAGFELIETLRWEPEAGFVRLDRHLARLYASAQRARLRARPRSASAKRCKQRVARPREPLRVRLTLSPRRRRPT